MGKNSMPKTAKVVAAGVELTVNQNGRVLHGIRSPQVAKTLVDAGHVTQDGGMLFVCLGLLAKAFGI